MSSIELKRNIKLLLWYKIASSMLFFGPIYILFLEEKFSLSEAILLQSIFVVFTGLFEVPAGVFADRFGKRVSLLISAVLGVFAITLYALASKMWQYTILEILLAMGYSLLSGTVGAYLYDTLLSLKLDSDFKKIWGDMTLKGMLSIAFAGIIGGLLAKVSYELTFYMTSATTFVAFIIALFLKEPKITRDQERKSLIKEASMKLLENKEVREIILISTIIYIFNQVLFNIYQPYYKVNGIDVVWFGAIFASFQIVAGFGAKIAHKYENLLGFKKGLWILALMVGVSIFLLGNIVGIYSFSFIYLQQLVRGIRPILVEDFIHKVVDSKERTTAQSLIAFIQKVTYFPAILLLSMLTNNYTLVMVINIIGVVFILFIVGILLRFSKYCKKMF